MIPEFIGRLPIIAALRPLPIDALVRVLTEPKNALCVSTRSSSSSRGQAELHRRRSACDGREGRQA